MSDSQLPASGDRREMLAALIQKLRWEINSSKTPASVVAQLARELRATMAELDLLPVPGKVNPLDEIARKRRERVATPDAGTGTGG